MKAKKFLNCALVALLLTGCSTETTSNTETTTPTETNETVDFQEQVIIDNDYCTVTLKEVDEDGLWGYDWKLNLVNKTDKTLMFGMENVSVNGVMADPFWASEVAAGKEANETVTWMSATLEENSLESSAITQVEFTLNVYDSDDWTADRYVEQEFTIYPKGEEAATTVEHVASDTDVVLIDNDQVTMTVTGFDPNGFYGFEMKLTIVNKTSQNIMVAANNVSIDGVMCDPFWADSIAANKTANETISWMDTTLEEAGLSKDTISSIEFPVTISDDDTYDTIMEQTFTIAITR